MDDVVNTTAKELPQGNKWQPVQHLIGQHVYYRADEVARFIDAYKALKSEVAVLKGQLNRLGPR